MGIRSAEDEAALSQIDAEALSVIETSTEGYIQNLFAPGLVIRLNHEWTKSFGLRLKRHGLSVSRWRVLNVVYGESGLSVNEVARRTALEQASASRIVEQLVSEGYLARQTSQSDGRVVAVATTAAGDELFKQIWPVAYREARQRLNRLTGREEATLIRLLKKLLDEYAHP